MKCDELKIEYVGYGMGFYPTEKVDEAIEELKYSKDEWAKQCTRLTAENAELKEENRKTKRALWMARKAHAAAMVAYWDSHYIDSPNAVYRNRTVDWLRNRWLLILDCCIKKEKEYK